MGKNELLCILLKSLLLLLHETCLQIPLLIVLNSEIIFWIVSAHYDLREVLKQILDHHAKNTVILVPGMHISRLNCLRVRRVNIFLIECRLNFLSPKCIILITATAIPFWTVCPRILESNECYCLILRVLNFSYFQDRIHVERKKSLALCLLVDFLPVCFCQPSIGALVILVLLGLCKHLDVDF